MPDTDRSNSRISIDNPRPSATSPSVANNCITLKIVPTLKKYPVPWSISPSAMMVLITMVYGLADGASSRCAVAPTVIADLPTCAA